MAKHSESGSPSGGHDDGEMTNEYIRLTEHAHGQIDLIWKNFGWFGSLIAVILTVIMFAGWNSLSDFKTETRSDLNDFQKRLSEEVKLKIDRQFEDQSIHSIVTSAAQDRVDAIARPVIQSNIEAIARTEIAPLKADVVELRNSQLALASQLANDVSQANEQYDSLTKQLEVLRLFFNARIGDASSLGQLLAAPASDSTLSNLVASLRSDLNAQYADFIGDQLAPIPRSRQVLLHSKTMQAYRPSEAQLHLTLTTESNPYIRQAGVNHVSDQQYFHFVQDLVGVVGSDSNVFVRCCAVAAIERLAGKTFSHRPLFGDVAEWWQREGRTNRVYQSTSSSIARAGQLLVEGKYDDSMAILREVTTNRTGFAHSHYLMAMIYYHEKKDREMAKRECEKAVSEADGQYAAAFLYANLLAEDNENGRAIKVLQKAKPYLDNFSERVKEEVCFKLLREEPAFKAMLGEK